ncbi:cell wall-binding repeat-containing protein [Kineococcus rubinsiae]|uniref:cell wall-binding repeat-containing protein n=1 Tax=Kineococcus rubinsiae TaxID=2609562 RepID=UPI00143079F5|nr:cell wall-binding repeat-containing protein [Kineococcus rubinsiae]
MTAATSRLRRRGIGAGVSALVGLSSVVGLAAAAHAAPGFTFPDTNRVAGADRYATAIAASTKAFPTGTQAGGVVLVSGSSTVDGLTASYVAGSHNAPILLVKNGVVDATTLAEINRLNVTDVYIVGGTTVVPEGVETQLDGKTITRFGGADRYETASRAATNNNNVTTQPGKVFIASGTADALAAAPVLYNKKYPLLLTRAASVPATTADALSKLTTANRTVLGGTTAVEAGTYTSLGGTVRIQGANRFETAANIAASAVANESFSAANVAIANGNDVAAVDSLTGSVVAGKNGVPLIFTNGTDVTPAATTAYLTANNNALTGQLYVFGGTTVVSTAATASVVTTVTTPVTVGQSLSITPTTAAALTVQDESGTTATADDRSYTVSGLTAGTDYRITLVDAESVRTAANGAVTFLSSADVASATGFSVNAGAQTAANITVVNNTTLGLSSAPTFVTQPVNGSITVTIDGEGAGAVVPVVYLNGGTGKSASEGGNSTRLETSATAAAQFAAPVESFGVGGQITYTSPLAEAGSTLSSDPIDSVDKATDSFDVAGLRYAYDANDLFRLTTGGTTTSVGLAAFEAALSSDDEMTIGGDGYAADAGGVTTFELNDVNPTTPTTVSAEKGALTSTSNDLSVTVAISPTAVYDQVVIQRAVVSGSPLDESAVNPANVGAFVDVATVTPTDAQRTAGSITYIDNDRANGAYNYRAALINDGDTGAYVADGTVETAVSPSTDSTVPTVVDARVAANTGSPFQLDAATDSFKLVASEVLAAPSTGDALRLTDTDGTVADIVNGTGTTAFTLNAAPETVGGVEYSVGRVLTVVVGTVTPGTVGTVTGLGIPSTITATSGNTDVAGNALSLSGDVIVDTES